MVGARLCLGVALVLLAGTCFVAAPDETGLDIAGFFDGFRRYGFTTGAIVGMPGKVASSLPTAVLIRDDVVPGASWEGQK